MAPKETTKRKEEAKLLTLNFSRSTQSRVAHDLNHDFVVCVSSALTHYFLRLLLTINHERGEFLYYFSVKK